MLAVTRGCIITQEDGTTKIVAPSGLLQNKTLPDSAFSASSGQLFINES